MSRQNLGRIFEFLVVAGLDQTHGLIPFKCGLEQLDEDESGEAYTIIAVL